MKLCPRQCPLKNSLLFAVFLLGVDLASSSAQTATRTDLNSVSASADNLKGNDGNFYGAASGIHYNAPGSLLKISPAGDLSYFESFASYSYTSASSILYGDDGNFYGVLTGASSTANYGGIYRATPAGAVTIFDAFTLHTGKPSSLVLGGDGNFYGTT